MRQFQLNGSINVFAIFVGIWGKHEAIELSSFVQLVCFDILLMATRNLAKQQLRFLTLSMFIPSSFTKRFLLTSHSGLVPPDFVTPSTVTSRGYQNNSNFASRAFSCEVFHLKHMRKSNWITSPRIVKIKNISNHHLVLVRPLGWFFQKHGNLLNNRTWSTLICLIAKVRNSKQQKNNGEIMTHLLLLSKKSILAETLTKTPKHTKKILAEEPPKNLYLVGAKKRPEFPGPTEPSNLRQLHST